MSFVPPSTPLAHRLHRNLTWMFIKQAPIEITIERRLRVPDGKGGFVFQEPPFELAPQTVRKVASFRLSATTNATSADGKVNIPTYALVAMSDADIERYDRFQADGKWYRVTADPAVLPGWRLQAEIVEEQ